MLFTVSVGASLSSGGPAAIEMGRVMAALTMAGLLDAAATYGDDSLSFTAQIYATDAHTALVKASKALYWAAGAADLPIRYVDSLSVELEPDDVPEQLDLTLGVEV